MPIQHSKPLRQQLVRLLSWTDAHVGFDTAVTGIPPAVRGVVPKGLPYSAWQLLEHMRLAQADILEFCARADYREKTWPADYWPSETAPPSVRAWGASVAGFKRDRQALERMIMAPRRNLFAKVPAGAGQTFLRECVLVADHTAYHVGQLVALRRLLGCWGAG